MDNGRTRMLADEQLRESLYCIRCGACLNVCPVYQKIGGQAYGWIYPGPIGAVISPQLQSLKAVGRPALCLESVWRVPRCLPGGDQFARYVAGPACQGERV